MAQAPVTGQYPSEKNTPALTLPFSKSVKGVPITKANLDDPAHPINIQNISGKTRGATILLDDDTVYWATGHLSSSPWKALGAGGGGAGTVQSVNGIEPDEDGNVVVPVGVKTINGVAPDADGNLALQGELKVKNVAGQTYTLLEADRNTMLVFDFDGIVTVTMPDAITATVNPAKVYSAINKQGAITFAGTGVYGGTDVPRGRVAGVVRIAGGWVITGAI